MVGMKHGSNPRRGRSRGGNGGKRHQPSRNQAHDSNGPEGKVRGSAQQVHEKYLSLARDATSAGEHIAAEGFYQFAEHYYRIANADGANSQNRNRPQQGDQQQNDGDGQQEAGDSQQAGNQQAADKPTDSEQADAGNVSTGVEENPKPRRNSRKPRKVADAGATKPAATEPAPTESTVSESESADDSDDSDLAASA